MIGGLMKTTSRFAIAAAAGVLLGGLALTPAQAADLGGDCCADLEERVAELEATTVRKGNRVVSLTLTGRVGHSMLFWDDGDSSDVYFGENNNGRSYFRMLGSAKIDPDVTAGYILEIDTSHNRTVGANQNDDDGSDLFGISDAALYLDSKRLGRLTLGKYDIANGSITSINLGDHSLVADPGLEDYAAGFFLKVGGVTLTGARWGTFLLGEMDAQVFEPNQLRYDTPTFAGFTASASVGEDDLWGIALRYAGEFGGFRVAAGIGYEECHDAGNCGGAEPETVAGSASILHVPTGLFLTFSGASRENNKSSRETDHWYISGGLNKKMISLGNTKIYGEYGEFDDTGTSITASSTQTAPAGGGAITTVTTSYTLSNVDTQVWGLGIVQEIDAAAMSLGLGYRHYEGDATCVSGSAACPAGAGRISFDEFDTVVAAAAIRF